MADAPNGVRRARRILFPHLVGVGVGRCEQGPAVTPKPLPSPARSATRAPAAPAVVPPAPVAPAVPTVPAAAVAAPCPALAAPSAPVLQTPGAHELGKRPMPTTETTSKRCKPGSQSSDTADAESSGTMLTWSGLPVSLKDMTCLDDGCMLNDSIMDFSMRLLQMLKPRSDTHLFSSHFFTRLTAAGAVDGNVGWENVKGWTKKTLLFSHNYAVVPINSELHWWLAVIELGDAGVPRMFCLDSLPGDQARYDTALHFLRGYLHREWTERAPRCTVDAPRMSSTVIPVPEQENGVDCGIFVLENFLQLLSASDLSVASWCSQEQATKRRCMLRRTLRRLEAEAARADGTRDVPVLLARRAGLVQRLQALWGMTA